MQKETRKYQIISHCQIVLDQYQNITLIGYDNLNDQYDVAVIQYSKTPQQAIKPLRQLTKKKGPYKQFSDVKNITSKYSKIINAKGLLGTIKLLQGYYLLYIQQISQVGAINNKPAYQIDKVSIIPLFSKFNDSTQADEQKHLDLLSTYEFQDLFFSYSYDMSSSFIQNMNRQTSEEFIWNYYFKEELSQIVGSHWIPNIIHGFFAHCKSSTTKLNNTILKFDLTIISRRNRFQDGVRYLKRGINQQGYVANHVQTQQIVALPEGVSSFLMVRGSVPVYWKQQPSIVNFQPKIQVMQHNSQYIPAQKHFYQLIKRYGSNIHCINLLREQESKPRQGLLTDQFQKLVQQISSSHTKQNKGIYYYEYDVKKQLKNYSQFQKQVKQLSYYLLLQTGCNILFKNNNLVLQNGVARINCVDCLDRTNLFMSILGEVALVFQLKAITRLAINITSISIKQQFCQIYSNIHQHLGNAVSLQYGGSEAQKHKVNVNKSQLLISLKRHITNNTSDYIKQQQIDICRGYFSRSKPYIWESFLETVERTRSMDTLLSIRQWIEQANNHYISRSTKKNMSKQNNSLLKSLREDFMQTMINNNHLSLKNKTIYWGDSLDYEIGKQQGSPSKILKQDNNITEILSPTKSNYSFGSSRQINYHMSFSK